MLNHLKSQPGQNQKATPKETKKRRDNPKPIQARPEVKREIFFSPYQREIFA